MTLCNKCGGTMRPTESNMDVSATPLLSGLVLACEDCGRPIRMLHRKRMSSGPRTRRDRAELNRVLRAARRRKGGLA